MKVLFVCTENVARSRAAETLFHELQGRSRRHEVRSVGIASHAARRLTTRDLAWADVIGVMEARHLEMIEQHWPHHADKVIVLDVWDYFLPEEMELCEALRSKVRRLLEQCDGASTAASQHRRSDGAGVEQRRDVMNRGEAQIGDAPGSPSPLDTGCGTAR